MLGGMHECRDPPWIALNHDARLIEIDGWAISAPVFHLGLGLISQLSSPLIHDGVQDHHVVIIELLNEVFDIEDCVVQYNCLMHRLSLLLLVAFEP